ncbi:hypothetical protein C4D60_Mb04t35990 [Musa balbisiana]|uniref:RmlD-like substrate binding domain-containing protein n=1 Tax=Musa balbisiana TaxID=52838 RepID=A0A4V4HAA5_MUSBA|nr:hypothetical protein C4D60_Mb04t35990 [Musa balbisiana]
MIGWTNVLTLFCASAKTLDRRFCPQTNRKSHRHPELDPPLGLAYLPFTRQWAVIDGLGLRSNGFATNGQNSAGLLGRRCEDRGISFAFGSGRLENRAQLEADIAAAALTHVFNAAGVTGRPNVDWCEDHRVDVEAIRANVVGTLTLGDVCRERGLLLVNCATGCIFDYDGAHTLGSGAGFKEEDTPNLVGSFCSKTKAMVEELLKNVCTLHVWMPVSSDLSTLAISLPKSPAMRRLLTYQTP